MLNQESLKPESYFTFYGKYVVPKETKNNYSTQMQNIYSRTEQKHRENSNNVVKTQIVH